MITRIRSKAADLVKGFAGDRKANVTMMFGLMTVPVLLMVATSVEYSRGVRAKTALQDAMDSAVLTAVQNAKTDTTFKAANAQFCAAALQNGVTIQNASGAAISCTGAQFFTLNSGANGTSTVTGAANASLRPVMLNIPSVTAINYNVSSTAKWSNPYTPKTVKFQFQYAKGWYYKVVTLYAQQTATSTPLPLYTWTYQVQNTNDVALPLSQTAVPYFWTQTGSQPSDTGIGYLAIPANSTNNVPGVPNSSNIAAVGATLDSDGTIELSSYYNLYLTMDVADQDCPLNQSTQSSSGSVSSTDMAQIDLYYSNNWGGSLTQSVQCSSQGRGSLSSYSMTLSTNSPSYSNYIYINGVEQPANTTLGVLGAFPCSANGTSVTNNYEMEDSSNSTSGTRDFFYSITTTCANNVWTNAPNLPILIR